MRDGDKRTGGFCRVLTVFLLGAFPLIFLSGCGPAGAGEKAEIRVVSPFNDDDGNRDNFLSACRAYETATGNSVTDESAASSEEWKEGILEDFEAGREPDVLFYFTGADADRIVESGKVVSISEIRRQYPDYASNMKEALMPVSTADGRQYAVPVNGYWEGLFVNKKVLAACGIGLPGADYDWEQFIGDCETVLARGYIPIACSLADYPHYWFEYCAFNHSGVAGHHILPEHAGDTAGLNWAAGLRDIKDLYDRRFFPENTLAAGSEEAGLLLAAGEAAFMIDGSWKLGWFEENAGDSADISVTYVPAKGERKASDIIGGLSMGYYITKKAWDDPEKRDACVGFVSAMTTDEVVSSFGALSVTALKNGTLPPEDAGPLALAALEMNRNCTGIAGAAQDLLAPAARGALFASVPWVMRGEMTPEQAADVIFTPVRVVYGEE